MRKFSLLLSFVVFFMWNSVASATTIELIHGGNEGLHISFEVADTHSSVFHGGNYDLGGTAGWEGIGVGSAADHNFAVGQADTLSFSQTTILSAGSASFLSFPRIEIYFHDASQWSSTWDALQGTTLTLDIKLVNAGSTTILDTQWSGEMDWVYPAPEPNTALFLGFGLVGLRVRRDDDNHRRP